MLAKSLVAGGALLMLAAIDTSGSSTTLTRALQSRHTLSFGDQGQLALQLDCNRGRASWSPGKPRNGAGSMSIGPIASTRALCPEPSFGNQMASGLSEARTYVLSADRRELVIESATLRFTFAAAE